jgi:hypothetical protein
MNSGFALFLAFGIGVVAGLRSMTAPAIVAWAAHLGWISLSGSHLAFMSQTDLLQPAAQRRTLRGVAAAGTAHRRAPGVVPIAALVARKLRLGCWRSKIHSTSALRRNSLLNSVYRKASKDKAGRSGLLVAKEAMMLETRAAWNNTLHEAACPAGFKGLAVGSKC